VWPMVFSATPDEQQREPAELGVAADAVPAMSEHRLQAKGAIHVRPARVRPPAAG
jgi:hypothetical protein